VSARDVGLVLFVVAMLVAVFVMAFYDVPGYPV
jgi:hypothetical protein